MPEKNFYDLNLSGLGAFANASCPPNARNAKTDWENGFSVPTENTPQFRILVHGLQSRAARTIQMITLLKEQKNGTGQYDPTQRIDLMSDPLRIHEKKLISTSCIDQDHRNTFGDVGFILSAPFENILDMSPKDSGTDFFNPDAELTKSTSSKSLMLLKDLMSQTSTSPGDGNYNEIRLTGETTAGKVRVIGVFIKVKKDGTPVDPEMAMQITAVAHGHGFPIKEIKTQLTIFNDQKVELHKILPQDPPIGISFQMNGFRYWVGLNDPPNAFKITDDQGIARSMTRSEATEALNKIESDLSRDDLAAVQDSLKKMRTLIPELPETSPVIPKTSKEPPSNTRSIANLDLSALQNVNIFKF